MEQFDIHDRVIALIPVGFDQVAGARGEVVGFDEDTDYIAVEFDQDIGGTEIDDIDYEDEDYECPEGHGWFVMPGDITHETKLSDIDPPDEVDLF